MNVFKKRILPLIFAVMLMSAVFALPGKAEEARVDLYFNVTLGMTQGGEKVPDFPLCVELFGFSDAAEDDVLVLDDSVYVRGSGEYSISVHLSVKREYLEAFARGFSLRMKPTQTPGLTLSQTVWQAAPQLFLTDDGETLATFSFSTMQDGEPVYADVPFFNNEYTAEYGMTTVEIPYTKTVVRADGSAAPQAQTFFLEVYQYGNPDAAQSVTVDGTVATNGAGSYTGMLKLTLNERDLMEGILEGGFYVREKSGEIDGWTFSDAAYLILPMHIETEENPYGEVTYAIFDASVDLSGELPQPYDSMLFTNTYYVKEQPGETPTDPEIPETPKTPQSPSTPEQSSAPKTGDSFAGVWYFVLCIVSMAIFAAVAFFGKRLRCR